MGDALAASAWRSLFDPRLWPELHELCATSVGALGEWDTGLRLEHLLEVLSQSLPLHSLVRIYAFMGEASPNPNHYGLALAPPHQHFTLNMDTLLEQAGFSRGALTHLHGQCNEPNTIVTTVRQYVALLPATLRDKMVAAVHGKNVLVTGYSGRDFDVFPLLVAHPPRHLRWLVYPGSELTAEVQTGLETISHTPGCSVDRSEGTLEDIFPGIWGQLPTDSSAPVDDWPPTFDFEDLPVSARALGAARVLFEIGELDKVARLAQLRPCHGGEAIHLRKVVARTARRRDQNARALLTLLRPPTTPAQARVWVRNGNEVSNLVSRMGLPLLGAGMDRAILAAARRSHSSVRARQLEMMLETRLAQRDSVLGRVDAAANRLRRIVHAGDIAVVLGPAGEADAITWLIDALKGASGYREAVDLLQRLEATLPYTNLSQRAYAIWQGGAVQLLRGQTSAALVRFDLARTVAHRAGDGQALAWVHASQSDALRGRDDERSSQLLQDALSKPTTQNYLARQYLLIQAAEHSRHLGDLDEARHLAGQAASIAVPGRLGPRRNSLNYLATEMIGLLIQAEREPAGAWAERAAWLRRRYEEQGARAAAADVAILEDHVKSPPGDHDISQRLDNYTAQGWLDQADRLRTTWDWRRPWHVIA